MTNDPRAPSTADPLRPSAWTPAEPVELAELARQVAEAVGGALGVGVRVRRTWLDTFDARLWRAGQRLIDAEVLPARGRATERVLRWSPGPGRAELTTPIHERPRFASELDGPSAAALADVSAGRALIPRLVLHGDAVPIELRDARDKVVLRLEVAALAASLPRGASAQVALPPRIVCRPVRGYAAHASRAADALSRRFAATPDAVDPYDACLLALGERPGHDPSAVSVEVRPDEPAAVAVRRVLRAFLDVWRANTAGVCEDLDIEFLHDLRVALRRSRAILKQLAPALPSDEVRRFADRLRWLGEVTGPTRDLDVFLEQFVGASVPVDWLRSARADARAAMVAELTGPAHQALVDDWAAFLADRTPGPRGSAPLVEVVDPAVRRLARRVRREAAAVDADTPAEALHELRKSCKKLRYVLEFFGGLYAPDARDACVAPVKRLQAALGDLQDLAVQGERVVQWADAVRRMPDASGGALLALGEIAARLRSQARTKRAALATAAEAEALRTAIRGLTERAAPASP